MKTILVVDDEPAMLDILRSVLEDEGYRVATAGNGREGLNCIEQVRPDMVLDDVMMPVLDGRDMCRALQGDPRHKDTPVLLMSAAPRSVKMSDCNYRAFISKPFDLDNLVKTVGDVLNGGGYSPGN